MISTRRRELFRLKMPVNKDIKKWLVKWLGYTQATDAEIVAGVTEIGNMLFLACAQEEPPIRKGKQVSFEDLDDFIHVWIPKGSYLSDEKIVQLNQTLYSYMIAQIVSVAIARKNADALKTPQTFVFEYYQNYFGIEMSTYALEKASQRYRSQRNFPRFSTRK